MAELAQSLAVCVTELSTLTVAMPTLLGPDHSSQDLLEGALSDVSTALFNTILPAQRDAGAGIDSSRKQLRALRSIQQLLSELSPAPVHLRDLDESIDLICGLLEIHLPSTR